MRNSFAPPPPTARPKRNRSARELNHAVQVAHTKDDARTNWAHTGTHAQLFRRTIFVTAECRRVCLHMRVRWSCGGWLGAIAW
ncbi:hypothetical protein LSTR_LSTR017140 [Laodelphax striatellus]|uniref:Uncharacterized protein n=1 Tax=Laodelphax striatellus TaxID=195883 RepID=A0A482XHS9_LAOST|nr:hypothetical protein LSTR_LSTR017140 [Laodelphax striatellus]